MERGKPEEQRRKSEVSTHRIPHSAIAFRCARSRNRWLVGSRGTSRLRPGRGSLARQFAEQQRARKPKNGVGPHASRFDDKYSGGPVGGRIVQHVRKPSSTTGLEEACSYGRPVATLNCSEHARGSAGTAPELGVARTAVKKQFSAPACLRLQKPTFRRFNVLSTHQNVDPRRDQPEGWSGMVGSDTYGLHAV